jgi:hypothetical protein
VIVNRKLGDNIILKRPNTFSVAACISLWDLDFEISPDKDTYQAGESAKGTLLTRADKSLKVRELKFSVCGKERYE